MRLKPQGPGQIWGPDHSVQQNFTKYDHSGPPEFPISYSLCHFHGATMTIKGHLRGMALPLGRFPGKFLKSRQNGAQNCSFQGKWGFKCYTMASRLPKGTSLARSALFHVFYTKISSVWGPQLYKGPAVAFVPQGPEGPSSRPVHKAFAHNCRAPSENVSLLPLCHLSNASSRYQTFC